MIIGKMQPLVCVIKMERKDHDNRKNATFGVCNKDGKKES